MRLAHKIAWIFFCAAAVAAVFLEDWRLLVVGAVGWILIGIVSTPTRK